MMQTIGRREIIDLPQLGLMNIEAKVDTGAYGSALHCHEICVNKESGKEVLSFKVLDPDHEDYHGKEFRFEEFDDKRVKNSGGEEERRYTIRTSIVIFDEPYDVEFSLTDRKKMKYPILLGRKFLSKKFIVDVDQKHLSHKKQLQK